MWFYGSRKTEVWGILFLWDISIQPSCSMLRRHWSKWTNLIEINFNFSLYIYHPIQVFFLFKFEMRQSISETPRRFFLVCLFSFLYKLICVVPIRIFSPLVLSLKHHKSNKWKIVFFSMSEDIQKHFFGTTWYLVMSDNVRNWRRF